MSQTWIIGSAAGCDIRVESPYVSARHCRLVLDGSDWTIEDLGSTNGTFVAGRRISAPCRVRLAETVMLGSTVSLPWPRPEPRLPPPLARVPPASRMVVGRGADCDIVLPLPMISSRHAELRRADADWIVRDLGSTNGTFVRGRRIDRPRRVASGERISLGSCRLELAADGDVRLEGGLPGSNMIEAQDVAVNVGSRRLIRDVSLAVRSGELVAIMGPSGAGKSTLLSAIVGYQRPSSGRVLVAGIDLHANLDEFRGRIGYVPQDDIMHADLTVERALWYSARLRLPRDYGDGEIRGRIAAVVDRLGLAGVMRTRIGTPDRRGISGGQRKRVNVAMELITDPPILVLDEPTSGLSSNDAFSLLRLLRELADGGKTVLLTIHQPGLDSFRLLDGLAVVAADASTGGCGELAWYGPAYPDAGQFFEPARDPPDAEAILRGLETRTVADWQTACRGTVTHRDWVERRRTPRRPAGPPPARARRRSLPELASQVRVLVGRMLAIRVADRWSTAVLLLQAPLIAALVTGIFAGKTTRTLDDAAWTDVAQGLATSTFLVALSAIWFGCSNAAREIVGERAVYRRERMVGLAPAAYLIAKILVLAGVCGLQCAALVAIVWRGCGLAGPPVSGFVIVFLAANVATTIGLVVSALARTAEAAAVILPLVILPMVMLGGILLPLPDLPTAAVVAADAMPSRWAFEGLALPESAARRSARRPDPDRPGRTRTEDLAEPWFPRDGWRSGSGTPALALAVSWLTGLVVLRTVMAWRDSR